MTRKMSSPYCFLAPWLLFIAIGFVGVAYAWWEGYLNYALTMDKTGFSLMIISVFFIGLAFNARGVIYIFLELKRASDIHKALSSGEINAAQVAEKKGILGYHVNTIRKMWEKNRMLIPNDLNDKHMDNIVVMLNLLMRAATTIAKILITLGLLGTVYGIMIAFSGFLELDISKADVFAKIIKPMGEGIAVAYLTTFFGMTLGGIYLEVLNVIALCGTERLVLNISRVMWRHIVRNWNDDYPNMEGDTG